MKNLYESRAYVVALVVALLAVALALSAPVPAKKPKKQEEKPALSGCYSACWGSWGSTMTFNADLTYVHDYGYGNAYVGSWQVKDGVLSVRERHVNSPDGWKNWSAPLTPSVAYPGVQAMAGGDYGVQDFGLQRPHKIEATD